jgi:hypothetical protein
MSPFLPTLDNLPTTDFHLIGLNVTDKNWASLRLNFFNAGQRSNSLLIPPTYVLISPTRSFLFHEHLSVDGVSGPRIAPPLARLAKNRSLSPMSDPEKLAACHSYFHSVPLFT